MTQAIRAGKAFVELSLKDKSLEAGIARAQQRMVKFGSILSGISAGITGPLFAMTKSFASAGDQIHKMSLRTGVAATELSALGYAAGQSGSNLESLGNTLFRMNRRIANAANGSGPAVRALQMLGLSAQQLSQMTADEQLKLVADAMLRMEDEGLAAQAAFEILGNGAKDLLPLLKSGSQGIEEMTNRAKELGIILDEEDSVAAANFTDAMDDLTKQLTDLKNTVGAKLAPVLTDIFRKIQVGLQVFQIWVRDNKNLAIALGKVAFYVGSLGAGVLAFAGGVKVLTMAVTAWTTATKALGVAKAFLIALTGPKGLALVAAATLAAGAATYGLGKAADYLTEKGDQAVQELKELHKDIDETAKKANEAATETDSFRDSVQDMGDELEKSFKKPLTALEELTKKMKEVRDERDQVLDDSDPMKHLLDLDPDKAQEIFAKFGGDESVQGQFTLIMKAREALAQIYAAAEKNERESVFGTERAYQDSRDAIRLAKGEVDEYGLALEKAKAAGATDEELATLKMAQDNEKYAKKIEQHKQDQTKAEAEAARIAERNMTPEERAEKERQALINLRKQVGPQGLSDEAFKREMARIDEDLKKDLELQNAGSQTSQSFQPVQAVEAGSQEALQTILRTRMGGKGPEEQTANNTKITAEEIKKQRAILAKMEREFRRNKLGLKKIDT